MTWIHSVNEYLLYAAVSRKYDCTESDCVFSVSNMISFNKNNQKIKFDSYILIHI